MKDIIYILYEEYVSDCDCNVTIIGAYDSIKKAKKRMDEQIKNEQKRWDISNNSSIIEEKSDNSYMIYEDGYFLDQHIYIKIEVIEKNI